MDILQCAFYYFATFDIDYFLPVAWQIIGMQHLKLFAGLLHGGMASLGPGSMDREKNMKKSL